MIYQKDNCKISPQLFPAVHTLQHIMSEPEEITTMSGQKLQLKMSVDYISFSAHTDYQQTSEFIRALKPPHVVWEESGVVKFTVLLTHLFLSFA